MAGARGLGRGLEALIPQDFDTSLLLDESERIQKIAVDKISPNEQQPRTHFDDEALQQLASSIKLYGVLQPLVVTPEKDGMFSLIAGERRWRASQLAGLKQVPVLVRSTRELERLEIALVENVQRVDLSPLEQAVSIERLHQQFSMSYDAIAKRLGKANSTINNIVRLLQLPPEARQALERGAITEGHARAVLALKDHPKHQAHLLQAIQAQGWSVRQAERYVTSVKQGVEEVEKARARVETETPATKQLGKRLGTSVHIRRTAHGGKLELDFKNDDELERLLQLLKSLRS